MYRGHCRVSLGEEEVFKIEKMLKEKWLAKDIVIKKFPYYTEISFSTEDYKKVFKLRGIVEKYGGKVIKEWIDITDQ